MTDTYDHLWNPLAAKLETQPTLDINDSLASWTDLLGFGEVFTQSDWQVSSLDWADIQSRLVRAYRAACTHFSGYRAFMLILNDGIIRTHFVPAPKDSETALGTLGGIGRWLEDVVLAHIAILDAERSDGRLGARTVIAAGHKMRYDFEEVKLDDFVVDQSRSAAGESVLAGMLGNPLLIYNPAPLQMNTAFSKAYLLDSVGTRGGLSGPNLYVDRSVLDLITSTATIAKGQCRIECEPRDSGTTRIAIIPTPSLSNGTWVFGLQLGPPVTVNSRNWTTSVYHVQSLYSPDENPEEGRIDLEAAS